MAKISALDIVGQLDGTELMPVVQTSATKRSTTGAFANLVASLMPDFMKGDPGADVMAIGFFEAAGQMSIPDATDLVQVSGHSRAGIGVGRYAFDPTIDAAAAAASPFDTFYSENQRGFRLAENVFDVTLFGAIGDGVHDDAPAIQRALDAVKRTGKPGQVLLSHGRRYRCDSGLVIERAFHNLSGFAVLDFSSWIGTHITVEGDYTEFGNSNGYNGSMTGQIIIKGGGGDSIGIFYNSEKPATATSILTIGVTVLYCGTAFKIGSRGYNQEFTGCKSFGCDVIFDWPNNYEDADERVTVIGGTFYNSRLFCRIHRSAGCFYVFSASIDYTDAIADIDTGKVQLFGCHLESRHWQDLPVKVAGNGGLFEMIGGWLFAMDNLAGLFHVFDIAAGCKVSLSSVITHGLNQLSTPQPWEPTTWATGPGAIHIHNLHVAYEYGGFPKRLSTHVTQLANHNFERPEIQESPVWRVADVLPIRSRDGSDAPTGGEPAPNMRLEYLARDGLDGAGTLRLSKSYGAGSPASAVILATPVSYGGGVTTGVRVRLDPQRQGDANRFYARGGFAILDGHDQYGVPIIRRFESPGEFNVQPSADSYTMIAPGNGLSQHVVPPWATHYIIVADLRDAASASYLIDARWADRF